MSFTEALVSTLTKLRSRIQPDGSSQTNLLSYCRQLVDNLPQRVAGQRAAYLDSVLEKPESEDSD